MNVELVAQMFKNYQSNVLFHLEGMVNLVGTNFASRLIIPSYRQLETPKLILDVSGNV